MKKASLALGGGLPRRRSFKPCVVCKILCTRLPACFIFLRTFITRSFSQEKSFSRVTYVCCYIITLVGRVHRHVWHSKSLRYRRRYRVDACVRRINYKSRSPFSRRVSRNGRVFRRDFEVKRVPCGVKRDRHSAPTRRDIRFELSSL